jgi:hypothetical protein
MIISWVWRPSKIRLMADLECAMFEAAGTRFAPTRAKGATSTSADAGGEGYFISAYIYKLIDGMPGTDPEAVQWK